MVGVCLGWGVLIPRQLPAQDTPAEYPLIPAPRELQSHPATSLARGVRILAASGDSIASQELHRALDARHVPVRSSPSAGVQIELLHLAGARAVAALRAAQLTFDPAMRDEGYVVVTTPSTIQVIAATDAGIFYGVQTVIQLLDGQGATATVRGAVIRDWPAMRYRGVHDDLSRGPLPTLAFQKAQIRTFAAYKLNVYSPYYEHTLAYSRHPLIGQPGGTMSLEDIRQLVAYAHAYHITVIPEQEAFGHLHQVLKAELYSPLAETPHGDVLAPGQPGSLALVRDLVQELGSLFPGPFVHLGADETFELGRGQTAAAVRADGVGAVYVDFLARLDTVVEQAGKRMLFWGDIVTQSPELIPRLPRTVIPVVWAYHVAPRFDAQIRPFRDVGLETWVAPGVSNWMRVYPNFSWALPNIQGLVRDGQRLGATGMLNTTWDDDGDALFNQTWYGILFGAAASWQSGESSIEDFQRHYGASFFGDTTGALDAAERQLMAAHQLVQQAGLRDASTDLFWLDPWSPRGQQLAQQMRPIASHLRVLAESAIVNARRGRVHAQRHQDAIDALEFGARRIDALGMKFQVADAVVRLYGRAVHSTDSADVRSAALDDALTQVADVLEAYALLRDEFARLWLRENRPYWMRNVLLRYDRAMQLWSARESRLSDARGQGQYADPVPSSEAMGIPAALPGLP